MRICVPTSDDAGLEAKTVGHFGSAPFFTVVDTESGEAVVVRNPEEGRGRGTCRPLKHLRPHGLDAIVCRRIGRHAFSTLEDEGVGVLISRAPTVAEVLDEVRSGGLAPMAAAEACRGHAHAHGHGHGHEAGCGEGRGHRHAHRHRRGRGRGRDG